MLLLTGATGLVGTALLRRLTAAGEPVRCLVRDPGALGGQRAHVDVAAGDLADPAALREAVRGVTTVVHLAAAIRDQPHATIEELNARATAQLAQAARRAGAERFVLFSALSAGPHVRTRFLRAKAQAEEAVAAAGFGRHVIVAPSIIYDRGDPFMALLRRMAVLPVVPVSGRGRAEYQPIWAQDVAECVVALLGGRAPGRDRLELAGPQTLTHTEIVRTMLAAAGRPRPLVHVPTPVVKRALRAGQALLGARTPATWDEAELMEVSMTTPRGPSDALKLGVRPRTMTAALGP
jgi:NADH dehydrogenase